MKPVKTFLFSTFLLLVGIAALSNRDAQSASVLSFAAQAPALLQATCGGCHNATAKAGGLDLQALPYDLSSAAVRSPSVEIHGRIEKREMLPYPASLPASLSASNWQALLKALGQAAMFWVRDAKGVDLVMVLYGSNLGVANIHDNTNLPIMLAGGGFKHGQHLAFKRNNNAPLCNLFVTMLPRLGIETDAFGSSNGALAELRMA